MRSADLNSWMWVGDSTYLAMLAQINHKARNDRPSGCVAFQVLALPFKHASPDLRGGRVMLARVLNVLQSAQWYVGVDKVGVAPDETSPLLVSGHSNWATAELLDSCVHLVSITLHDTGKSVVSFLNLADNDGLEFTPRVLEVEVRLRILVCAEKS